MLVAIPQNWLCEHNSSIDGSESTMRDVNTGLCGTDASHCRCHRRPESRRLRPTHDRQWSRRPPLPRYAGCSCSRHGNQPEGDARPVVGCHVSSVSSRRTLGAAAVVTTSHYASGGPVDIPDNGGMDKLMCFFRKGLYLRHTWYSRGRRSKSCTRTTSFVVSPRS